jgi:protein gp37
MMPEWVTDVRHQCARAGVPFFFKQWGGIQKKRTGRNLDGRTYDEMPSGPLAERQSPSLSLTVL